MIDVNSLKVKITKEELEAFNKGCEIISKVHHAIEEKVLFGSDEEKKEFREANEITCEAAFGAKYCGLFLEVNC